MVNLGYEQHYPGAVLQVLLKVFRLPPLGVEKLALGAASHCVKVTALKALGNAAE